MTTLDQQLTALRSGAITFETFVRATTTTWRAISKSIARRWDLPAWHDAEDIEQDLLLTVWSTLDQYDPARGVSLRGYVIWRAYDRAKKRVHRNRNAYRHRRADFAPSRYELPLSTFDVTDESGHTYNPVADRMSSPPKQLDSIIVDEIIDILEASCESERELAVMRAIASTGAESLSAAAAVLYDSPDARRVLRIDSEAHAEKIVLTAFRRVVDAVAA